MKELRKALVRNGSKGWVMGKGSSLEVVCAVLAVYQSGIQSVSGLTGILDLREALKLQLSQNQTR